MKKILIFWPLWLGLTLSGVIWVALKPAPSAAQRGSDYNVVVISGCEYIERPGYHYFLTHKANCTNSIHGHE